MIVEDQAILAMELELVLGDAGCDVVGCAMDRKGAFEIAETGDLANWSTSGSDRTPAVGGAMDLAAGARNVWVMTTHVTKAGEPKLVRQCRYPLTGWNNCIVICNLLIIYISRFCQPFMCSKLHDFL